MTMRKSLLQPLPKSTVAAIGLALAAGLLHEHVSFGMVAVTLAVIMCVAGAKRFSK